MDTNKLVSGHLSTLTGDPVDIGRGLTEEASQKLHREQNPHLYTETGFRKITGEEREALQKADPKLQGRGELSCLTTLDEGPFHEGTVDHGTESDTDFAIPGLDPDAVAPDGVDAAADDSGCEGGACKI